MKKPLFFLILSALNGCDSGSEPEKSGLSIQIEVKEKNQPASGVSVRINSDVAGQTSSDGLLSVKALDAGSYVIRPEQSGRIFFPQEEAVDLVDQNENISFTRLADDQIVHQNQIWNIFNQIFFTVPNNTATTVQLDLIQNALWFNSSAGGLLYRTITGDFNIQAHVRAVRRTNNTQPAVCNICLGGLMVRDMTSAQQNYIHLVTGITPGGAGVETKSTVNSTSIYVPTGAGQLPHTDGFTEHDLRIQRSGNTFNLFKKSVTDTNWVACGTYQRSDLPPTVGVGLNIYTAASGSTPADLSIIVENLVISQ
jgi:hypothetical protein